MTSYVRTLADRLGNATVHPWLARPELHRSGFGGILLVPSAAYHAEELLPVGRALDRRGHPVTFITTRAAPNAVRRALHDWEGRLYAWPRLSHLLPSFSAVVVMNDWGPTRALVDLARERCVPSFAKVEGAQDFADVDTGRTRKPYRRVDVVLCQGAYDVRSLPGKTVRVVGNHRLETVWKGPERSSWNDPPRVVINSNYTYGVLEGARHSWVQQAINATEAAGCIPVVSQHPAEPPMNDGTHSSQTPMSALLAGEADLLVSRFSTVPLEAMAYGVPFVYFNPHREQVPMYREPAGAFPRAESLDELREVISQTLLWRGRYRSRCADFFKQHVDMLGVGAANRTADVIADYMATEYSAHNTHQ